MRRTHLEAGFVLLLWALVPMVGFGQDVESPAPTPDAAVAVSPSAEAPGMASGSELSSWMRRARVLELENRWGEALAQYEDAMRQFPEDASVRRRFDTARQHFDVARRYADRSFRGQLATMSADEALDLYSEVLLKIQSHYVDAPHWSELLGSGASSLEIAMGEKQFWEPYQRKVTLASIDSFRQELRSEMTSRQVNNRAEAREAVAAAAALAHDRLGVSATTAVLEFLCGAAAALDQYSTFLTPDQLNEVYSQIDGNFVGLGVELKAQEGALLILRVIPNSPARRAGIAEGDRILAVEGRSLRDIPADQAANLLQGPSGSTVALSVESPGGSPREVTARRQRVEVPSVEEPQILDPARGIAYFKLSCFQKTTLRDVDNALWSLHRAGMKKLIIDLRGNPGGLLLSAVEVADLFLERGLIVTTHGRNKGEDSTYTAREPGTWRVPLVLMVDQESASAAEIFAGAIHDHHRGTLVGKRSYGKGSVQSIFQLSKANTGLRLTTAKFYSPLGKPYSGAGVEPDVVLHQTAKPPAGGLVSPEKDPALAAALRAAEQAGNQSRPLVQRD